MFHQRYKDAVRGSRDGDRARWRLLCRGLSLRIDRRLLGKLVLCVLAAIVFSSVTADEPTILAPPRASAPSFSINESQARASMQWLATLAIQKVPRTIDGDKDWGKTKRIWAGVKIRRDGFKLKTHRRFREVEHGRWVKYEVRLAEPTADNAVTVTVDQVVPTIEAATGDQRWRIDSSIVVPMNFTARVQRWNRGVKVFSMTITGRMRVRLTSSASLGFFADYAEIPPALVVDPRIEQAHLVLERFEVDRISNVGGDVAEGWGEVLQEILVQRLVKKQNKRLVGRLNESIEQERDDLRLSMADWLANW